MRQLSLLRLLFVAACIYTSSASMLAAKEGLFGYNDNICSSNGRHIMFNQSTSVSWQSYASFDATPPNMQINGSRQASAPGLIFIGPAGVFNSTGVEQQAPVIMTDDNELVWSGRTGVVSNFKRQQLYGRRVLSFWTGTGGAVAGASQAGHGYGRVVILDDTYRQIHSICPQLNLTKPDGVVSECDLDVHESYITPRNTILVTAYNITQADLTSLGGSDADWVYEPLAVEIDVETEQVLFTWSPLAHVPVEDTHFPYSKSTTNRSAPFDWFHMNSIQAYGDKYLINSRHTWTTYLVNKSGDIEWRVDGKTGGSFGPLPQNGSFSWQHMARLREVSPGRALLTYFANNNFEYPLSGEPSKGLSLLLTLPPDPSHPPQLVTSLWNPESPIASLAEGSLERLTNNHWFMGYGVMPYLEEYDTEDCGAPGKVIWSAMFAQPGEGHSYRAFKDDWIAIPSTRPSLVVKRSKRDDDLSACANSTSLRGYVSWNGATNVAGYVVYAGVDDANLIKVGVVKKRGFETKFPVPSDVKVVQVAPVVDGNEQRRSNIVVVD